MSDKKNQKSSSKGKTKLSNLADKRAANLRANLQKRKAQLRERKEK